MMNTSMHLSEERRAGPRRPYHAPVRVHVRGPGWTDSFILYAADVSESGLFLRSDWLYDRGETLDLELVVEGHVGPIRGEARVKRVAQTSGGSGMVVGFERFAEDGRRALRGLLA